MSEAYSRWVAFENARLDLTLIRDGSKSPVVRETLEAMLAIAAKESRALKKVFAKGSRR